MKDFLDVWKLKYPNIFYTVFDEYVWSIDLYQDDTETYGFTLEKSRVIGESNGSPLTAKDEEIVVEKQGGFAETDDALYAAVEATYHHMYIARREEQN